MVSDLLGFIERDKLGFALLVILFALLCLAPIQLMRILRKRGSDDPAEDSSKRLARLEAEREKRMHSHFLKVQELSTFVHELGYKMSTLQKDVADLERRMDAGETLDAEFRDRLLRVELSANVLARDARAARQSLERPALAGRDEV